MATYFVSNLVRNPVSYGIAQKYNGNLIVHFQIPLIANDQSSFYINTNYFIVICFIFNFIRV